jgi:hypothetical protein
LYYDHNTSFNLPTDGVTASCRGGSRDSADLHNSALNIESAAGSLSRRLHDCLHDAVEN